MVHLWHLVLLLKVLPPTACTMREWTDYYRLVFKKWVIFYRCMMYVYTIIVIIYYLFIYLCMYVFIYLYYYYYNYIYIWLYIYTHPFYIAPTSVYDRDICIMNEPLVFWESWQRSVFSMWRWFLAAESLELFAMFDCQRVL